MLGLIKSLSAEKWNVQKHEKTGLIGDFHTVQNGWAILCVAVGIKKENKFERYLGDRIKRIW